MTVAVKWLHNIGYEYTFIYGKGSITLFVGISWDHLCGLVVRVPGYRSRGRIRFLALPDFLRSSGS
jgi:hypothetical protein